MKEYNQEHEDRLRRALCDPLCGSGGVYECVEGCPIKWENYDEIVVGCQKLVSNVPDLCNILSGFGVPKELIDPIEFWALKNSDAAKSEVQDLTRDEQVMCIRDFIRSLRFHEDALSHFRKLSNALKQQLEQYRAMGAKRQAKLEEANAALQVFPEALVDEVREEMGDYGHENIDRDIE